MASNRIKGITIEIDGDTTKLGKALDGVEKSSRNLQSELKGVNSLLKMNPSSVELIKQKQDLLTKSISSTEEKLKTLKAAQAQVQEQFDKGKITEEQYRDFQREIVATEQKLKGLKDEAKEFGTEMNASLKSASEKLNEFGTKTEAAGKKMLGVTAGVTAVGTAAVAVGLSFDESMSKVQAISGATGEEFEKLRDKAQELGSKTKFTATESAEALNYMAMAGWDTESMLDGIDGVLSLAAASGTDLATTSDIVTDALTALGMSASDSSRFADILATTTARANTTVEGLGESFKYVAPLAGAMKYSAEDLSKALGLMANAGIKGSMSGTALKTAIANMASPTKAMADAMEQYNISLTNSDGTMKTLDEVMLNLRDSLGGLSETEQAAAASTIFGKEAMAGMLSIINASEEDYNKLGDAINNASGSAEEMANTMQDNLKGKLTVLKSQLEGIAIQLSDILAPVLSKIADLLSKVLTWFSNLSPAVKKVVVVIASLVAAIGPVLIIVGKMATGLSSIITVAGKLAPILSKIPSMLGIIKTAVSGVMTVVKLLGSVIMANPVVAIIAGIIAVLVLLYTKCEWFRDLVHNILDGIVAGIKWLGSILAKVATWIYDNVLKPIITFYLAFYTLIFEGIVAAIKWLGSILAKVATWIYDNVLKPVIDFFTKCYETIKNAFVTTWNFIKNIFSTVANWINTYVVQPIVNFFTNLWNSIKNIFGNVKSFFTDKFKQAYNGIKEAFGGVKDWFNENVWGKIKSVFSGAKEKMAEIGGKIWSGLKSAFKNPLGLKVTYDTNVGKVKKAIYSALGLDGWPKLSFAAKGAVSRKPTPLLTGEYPNAVNNPEITTPQSIMRDTMMDALTDFNNVRHQNASTGDIGELTRLLKVYMPKIVENMDKDMVLDGRKVGKLIAPTINKELGVISAKEQRGY